MSFSTFYSYWLTTKTLWNSFRGSVQLWGRRVTLTNLSLSPLLSGHPSKHETWRLLQTSVKAATCEFLYCKAKGHRTMCKQGPWITDICKDGVEGQGLAPWYCLPSQVLPSWWLTKYCTTEVQNDLRILSLKYSIIQAKAGSLPFSANSPVVRDSCTTGIVIQKVKQKRGRADVGNESAMKGKVSDRKKKERMW